MKPLKCERCGASDFEERNGMYVCRYCGAKYPMDQGEAAAAASTAGAYTEQVYENGSMGNAGSNRNASTMTMKSPKSKTVTLLFCIFFGVFGVHRFYTGKIGTGILWLLTGGVAGVGVIVDLIMIVLGKFKDKQGRPITYKS